MQGLLQLLETGEAPESQQPPGLTVSLRPYQRQSLKFMQDAEACQGGFGSHLWVKIEFGSTTFWWSPIIKRATLQDPACYTRGGFLAGADWFSVLFTLVPITYHNSSVNLFCLARQLYSYWCGQLI